METRTTATGGFRVWLTNFGWFIDGEHDTVTAAIAHGKSRGFDFTVVNGEGNVVAGWSVIGGARYY